MYLFQVHIGTRSGTRKYTDTYIISTFRVQSYPYQIQSKYNRTYIVPILSTRIRYNLSTLVPIKYLYYGYNQVHVYPRRKVAAE